ncbi:hypothetical protein M378DRAFT_160998 [Amanita muscaria Koide BX008]|uniref:Uncharacterized protein n=1 Tax=Amanita muscaria (strain Koide BX008) TaxID=946122 RepID=A0A0C2ST46_AMAMK|nr:hypothetical protein M378DRAFT_160998 [Amanita muscaria Koide BX008]
MTGEASAKDLRGARLAGRSGSSSPVHNTKRNQDGCYCLTSLVTAHLAWTPTYFPSLMIAIVLSELVKNTLNDVGKFKCIAIGKHLLYVYPGSCLTQASEDETSDLALNPEDCG